MGSSQSLPTSASAVSPSPSPTPTPEPAPPALRRRTFEQLVEEELPIQRASVAMEGGAPSCMTLFDDFFSCFSLGTQARSLYRHGHARDCTPKFSSFKFCMSIKSLSPEKREEVWIRRRAEWWARRRLEKSSEDVWEARRGVYQGQEGYREAQEERERGRGGRVVEDREIGGDAAGGRETREGRGIAEGRAELRGQRMG